MGFVYIERRVCPLRDFHDVGQGRPVAVHTENRVGYDEANTAFRMRREQPLERGRIAMWVNMYRRLRQSDAVDEACMDQLVGKNSVAFAHKGGENPQIGLVPRDEQHGGLFGDQFRRLFFSELVARHVARNQPRRTGPRAPGFDPLTERLSKLGMPGEAQVIVGTEYQAIAIGKFPHRAGRPFEAPKRPLQVLRLQAIQARRPDLLRTRKARHNRPWNRL